MVQPSVVTKLVLSLLLYGFGRLAFAEPAEAVFAKAAPSVVVIHATNSSTLSQGSGIVVAPNTVATNCHVVRGASNILIMFRGQSISGSVKSRSDGKDLCLISASLPGATVVAMSSAADVRIGQRVYAIGAPRGLELSLSDGIVSSVRAQDDGPLIQTTAAISPGSSGGGLFDETGRLIGLTTFMIRDSQSLNFALPVDWVRAALAGAELNRPSADSLLGQIDVLRIEMNLASRTGGGCYGETPREIPFSTEGDRIAYANWVERASRILVDRLALSAQLAVGAAKTLYYESKRAGLDPDMMLGVMVAFGKPLDQSTGSKTVGMMHVDRKLVNLIKESLVSQSDSACFDFWAPAWNYRLGCLLLRHYIDESEGNLYLALRAYGERAADLNAEQNGVFPNQVLTAWKSVVR